MQVSFRLVGLNQIKCNFCHNWIEGLTLSRKTINACEDCIFKYRHKQNEVRTENGQVYKMLLLSEQEHQGMSIKRLLEHFQQIRQSQLEEQQDQTEIVRSIIQGVEDFTQLKTKLNSNIKHVLNQSNDPIDDVNQSFMRTKSKSVFIDQLMNKEKQIYQSYDYDYNNNEITSKPRRCFKKFQDLCPNLAKTRFARRYQFYYGSQQIKKYQQKDRKLEKTVTTERTFGTSISNVFPSNQYLHLKQKQQKMTYRSTTSIESISKSLKLSEEELKNRIDAYLESRYASITLHRLMAAYVKQAYHKTKLTGKMLQLISFDISTMDLLCYLSLFDFDQINTIKLIKVSLTDDLLHTLVESIKTKTVERLVVSCNRLTENSLPIFLNRSFPYLKQIYLGKNRINKYRMKQNILELRRKFILYL